MAVPDWVDPVAKASEIVGAVVGVLAFAHDTWPKRRTHATTRPPRGWLRIAALLGAVSLASLFLPRAIRIPIAIGAAVGALTFVMLHVVQRRRGLLPLPTALRTLIDRQYDEARHHTYQFTVGTGVPPLPDIYVEQHAESWEPRSGPRARLALAAMLREQHGAVVIAEPGVGKSTAIAKVLWEQCGWLRTARRHHGEAPYGPVIPIALPADLHGRASIAAALAAEWERVTGGPPADGLFESPPPYGKSWLVLVDGVDQVLDVTERQRVLDLLGTWPTGAARHLLITSRPLLGSEFGYLKDRTFFRLTKFDVPALEDFASRWVRFRLADPMRPTVVDAETFLSCVRKAPLASLVRVPLIATITYLLLEASGQPLPASRAKLYERYVLHLLSSRQAAPPPPAFTVHHALGERAWDWLSANLRPLLEGTADQVLTVGTPTAHDCAVNWIKSAAPDGMFDQVTGWEDGLDSLLTSASLIVPDRGGLVFAHPSFAEYLAAGPRSAGRLDVETWLADAQSPDSRSLALFTLARRCAADGFALAEEVIVLLLARGGVDACVAGEIIADGIGVSAKTQSDVIDRLFGLLAVDDLDTGGALRTLALLAADHGVRSRLVAFADDTAQPEWVRADVAEELCGTEPSQGIRLLRSVLTASSDTWLRRRILLKLTELGVATDAERQRAEYEFSLEQSAPASSGARAGEWFRQVAQSAANSPVQRLSAALALADRRDELWRSLVAGLIANGDVSADNRFQAARRLSSSSEGMALLRQVAERLEPDVRIPVLAAMSSARDEWARQLLNEELYRNGAALQARFPQLDAWREEVGERSYTQRSALPPRDPHFTGREDVLREIQTGLASGRPVCLTGIAGVGKTAIAVEYAHRHLAEYDLVLWGPPGDVDWIIGDSVHYLMVLEGVEDAPRELPGVDVLTTTRAPARWQGDFVTVDVRAFSREEAEHYLRSRLPRGITRSEANWLSRKLGDLPLALDVAAGYLAETGASVEDYLTQLAATGAISDPATDGRILVTLQSLAPEVLDLLCCCVMFAEAPIPVEVFRPSGLPDSPMRDLLADEIRFGRALRELTRRSLLEVTDRSVTVPRSIRSLIRTSVASGRDHAADARMMLAVVTPDPEDVGTWPVFRELLPHLLELGGGDPGLALKTMRYLRLSGKPQEAAQFAEPLRRVRDVAAEYTGLLVELGRYREARVLPYSQPILSGGALARAAGNFGEALVRDQRHRETIADAEPVDLARADANIGLDLILTGDFDAARRTLNLAHTRLGRARAQLDTLRVQLDLARACWLAGSREQAEGHAAQALDACLVSVGDHPLTYRALKEQSIIARNPGSDSTEIATALDKLTEVYGPDHPETLAADVALANEMLVRGDLWQAHTRMERVVAKYRDVLGEDHPFTLACEGNLAVAEHQLGRPAVARAINERCLAKLRADLGIYALTVATNLARDLFATGEQAAAVELGNSTHAQWIAALVADHPFTRVSATNLILDQRGSTVPREFLLFDPPRI